MVISLDDLEKCFQLLLSHAQQCGIRELDSGVSDYYWNVPPDEWLNFQEEPVADVGSIDDDMSELKKLLAEPSRVSIVDFERLASLLKLLSVCMEQFVISKNQ